MLLWDENFSFFNLVFRDEIEKEKIHSHGWGWKNYPRHARPFLTMTIDTSPSPPTTTTNKLFLQQQIPAQINQLRFLPVQQRTNSSSIFSATDKNDIYDNDENTKMVMRRIKIALGVLTEGCCKVGFCSILASNSSAAAWYTMNKGATEFDQIIMESNINWTIMLQKKNTKTHSSY